MSTPTQMTAGAFFLILFFTSTARASTYVPDSSPCDANTTCSIGEYCLDGFCESCVPCEMIQHRQSPPPIDGTSCAKEEAQCGSCLPGYEEQSLTDSSQMRKCSLISTSPVQTDIPDFATCDANTTCQIGFFCSDAGQCEMCAPCESRGRESPPPIDGISCARKEEDCGSCLQGYEEESLINISPKRKCYPMLIPSVTSSISLQSIFNIAVVLGLVLALCVFFKKQLKKHICCNRGNISLDSENPSTNVHSVQNEVELKSLIPTISTWVWSLFTKVVFLWSLVLSFKKQLKKHICCCNCGNLENPPPNVHYSDSASNGHSV